MMLLRFNREPLHFQVDEVLSITSESGLVKVITRDNYYLGYCIKFE